MPVSPSQQATAQAVAFRFGNPQVMPDMMTATDYTQFAQIMPKGLRGSMLKVIDWPTSWATLYDLSPAQISQDRERANADSAWNRRAGEENRLLIWKKLLRAYFVGQPDPMPESDFPRWRKPFWMTDAERLEIDNLIREAYANEGDASMAEVADGEVSFSEEQTTDAPMEQTTSAEDEPTEQVQQDSPNVRRLSQVEGVYQLYASYFSRVHNATRSDYLEAIENRNSPVRRSAESILALEKLGYSTDAISDMLSTFANRSLAVVGLRGGNRGGYGAFLIVDLQGIRSTARAYQSAVSRLILTRMGGVSRQRVERQFRPEGSRPLQTFKFSGMRRRQIVGLQVVSLNDISGTPNDISLREGNNRVAQAKADAQQVFDSQATATATGTEGTATPDGLVSFIGFQFFPEGQTYRQNGEFNISLNKFPDDGRTYSYVFYFAKTNAEGGYNLFRSVFGPLPPDSRISAQNDSGQRLAQLKMAWNRSGRLSRENVLELQEIPVLDKRKLRQAFGQQEDAGLTTRGIDFPVTRSEMRGIPLAFNEIQSAPLRMIVEMGARFRRLGTQEPDEASTTAPINLLSSNQLRILSESPYSFGFGIEFEGFIREGTRKQLSENLRAEGVKVYSTEGYRSERPVRGEENYVEGHRWRQEADSSVTGFQANTSGGYDPSGRGQTFEMVSVILNESVDNKSGNNDWIPEIEQYCTALAKHGVLVDPSSGIHIHVGYKNFDAQQTKNFFINSVLMLPVLKGLVSEAWKGRGYAKFPSQEGLQPKLSRIASANNTQDAVVDAYRDGFGEERYSWLNTQNYGVRGKPTFEFRFQGSSIEKDTMVNTIKILQQIWKASLEGVIPIERGAGKAQDQVLIDLLGTPLYAFARNRYAETELPSVTSRRSNSFKGFDFPISASQIT